MCKLISHANLLWINLGDGKCGFLEVKAPRKSWISESQSESKGPHGMDLALMSQPGFPVVKWPREAKIRVKVRALAVIDLALRRRCVLHRGRSVAEGTPLNAPISLLIDRNYTITVWFFDLVFSWLLHKEYMAFNDKLCYKLRSYR